MPQSERFCFFYLRVVCLFEPLKDLSLFFLQGIICTILFVLILYFHRTAAHTFVKCHIAHNHITNQIQCQRIKC